MNILLSQSPTERPLVAEPGVNNIMGCRQDEPVFDPMRTGGEVDEIFVSTACYSDIKLFTVCHYMYEVGYVGSMHKKKTEVLFLTTLLISMVM